MPKLPPSTDKEVIRVLKKLGFLERPEHGSSHLGFKHPDGRITMVSRHPGKEIPIGTLRAILHDINISVEDFIRLRKSK